MGRSADDSDIAQNLFKKIKSYDPDFNQKDIERAIEFAKKYHGSQKRYSGDPYYHHPLAVAKILADMKLDDSTIITAILHDTVEDTEATVDLIKKEFSEEISQLVDGVTKLTKIEFQSDNERQAENFRKLLIAISEDIRVLLVKLADRLHNMRTLHHIKKDEKRRRIAHETMEIYAPLAERIGMQKIKDELQNLSFREMNPDGYKSVTSRLEFLRESGTEVVNRTVKELKKLLKDTKIDAKVLGREKMPYSIWRKMEKKNVGFEQLSDIIAFRIIVGSNEDCYRALGLIHSAFHTIPENFKDFISTPKNNGYQSIHTVVIGPEQNRIEIQIRTKEMHDVAEMGVAAHWSYKQGRPYSKDSKQYKWIRELLYIIEHAQGADEFLENTKLEMYHDQVFCFTPRGDIIALPRGATPVDFAFAVHSAVGRSCVGAKINSRIMPLRTQLKNGDQVEIIQSKSAQPSPAWEHFVITGKALSEIRRFIRTEKRSEYVTLGKAMLSKSLQSMNEELHEKLLEPHLEKFKKSKIEDIYAAIGEGVLGINEVVRGLFPERYSAKKPSLLERLTGRHKKHKHEKAEKLKVPIMGLIPGMAIHFAGCCHPLPGEKIAGIVNSGKGVTIHTIDCPEMEQFVDSPERWIDVAWERNTTEDVYVGRLKVVLSHKKGALGSLANAIAKGGANINNVRIISRSDDFFEIIVDVEVHDITHLNNVVTLLHSKKNVHSVERYKEGSHDG